MKEYGLIGHPLGHSFSKKFFTDKFYAEGIDASYSNFDIPKIEMLKDIILEHPMLMGLNCTIPHKESVIPLLDETSKEAQEIGAVNVIKIQRNEAFHGGIMGDRIKLTGYNSDVIGFTQSILPLLKPHHKKALILGTGGASKAIKWGLEKLGIECSYVSRSRGEDRLAYEDITTDIIRANLLIVNCTPVGMFPHTEEVPPIPYEALTPKHILYDLVYNPEETLFLKRGKEAGAQTKNGLEMLRLQALAGWDIWTK